MNWQLLWKITWIIGLIYIFIEVERYLIYKSKEAFKEVRQAYKELEDSKKELMKYINKK